MPFSQFAILTDSIKSPIDLAKRGHSLISNWVDDLNDYLPRVALAIAILLAFYYLGKFIRRAVRRFVYRFLRKDKNPEVVEALSILLYCFFLLSGIYLAMDVLELGDTLTKVLTSAGILGIIAGFAFQDIASNVFAGLLLKYHRPFHVSDWIGVGDHFGTVDQMNWLTTNVKLVSGEAVYIPNRLIYDQAFTNYTANGMRRISLKTGVAYGEDLTRVKRVSLEEAARVKNALLDRDIDFYYTQIGDFAYHFELRFWIRYRMQLDYLEAMSDIIMRIQDRFKKEDISIAYPVTTLDFGVRGGRNIFDKPIQVQPMGAAQSPRDTSTSSDSTSD
ncbi:MAG: mechanosensitive ion channel [Flavobacteriales bacterium]